METAEQFARRIGSDPEMEWSITPLIAAIEADRNATRLALLDELEAHMLGFFKRNPDHSWTHALPLTFRELQDKYATLASETRPQDGAGLDQAPTSEKRAELRRLAEACPDDLKLSCVECGSCYVGECQCVGRKRFNFEFNRYRVLSLLDALDAAEAKLQPAKSFAYVVGFSDGFARATNYGWIGPVPNNPYDKEPR